MGNCPSYVCQYKQRTEGAKEVVTNVTLNVVERIRKDFVLLPENENVQDPYYGTCNVLEPSSVQHSVNTRQESLHGFKLVHRVVRISEADDFKAAQQSLENRFYGLNHPNLLVIHGKC